MQQVSMAKSIKNDMWISDEDKLNPDVLPDLPGYHILVRPVSIGLLLALSFREEILIIRSQGKREYNTTTVFLRK